MLKLSPDFQEDKLKIILSYPNLTVKWNRLEIIMKMGDVDYKFGSTKANESPQALSWKLYKDANPKRKQVKKCSTRCGEGVELRS